jgi:Flp pilus assembly protein TadG
MVLPILLVIVLGVVEAGYALMDQHVVTKLTREGSNLTSRDVSLQDARAAMVSMSVRPIDFGTSARLILSVLKKGATTGTPNFDQVILYQRHEYGGLTGVSSKLTTAGSVTFGGAPDYIAPNPDTNTNLRVTNVPDNLVMATGGMIYVTEIYTAHPRITPLDRFGIAMPTQLYSIAYF